jgi:putative spermidine/putrescine transport system substrate-binding protein
MKRQLWAALSLAVMLAVGAAGMAAASVTAQAKNEGKVNILAWAGYAEDGSTDKAYDWVTPFEKKTGCKASVKTFNTSDEAFQLFATGQYDVVSASGDSALRSIVNGDAAPINLKRVKSYADLADFMKDQAWNSYKGKTYGVPHGWGANVLLWNQDAVTPAPTSWGVVFDESSPYAGKITAPDNPIYIADAALYLSKTQPDLGITNPYALDRTQFDAAVALLKQQKANIGEYWDSATKEQEAFTKASSVVGAAWEYQANLVRADDAAPPVETAIPAEGATAWSDNWFVHSDAKHPNCAYAWINWITSPKVQTQESEYYGEAPANLKACTLTSDGGAHLGTPLPSDADPATTNCALYHAEDPTFYEQLSYWVTPTTKCLDGRSNVKCVAYKDWLSAWDEIKAS